ncbi:DNA-binding protein [Polynucleobacter paneuropaeus]|uniref:DNA-binding protein n=1 Tax=Polynucleobacter paneuropaeus TaxID=2527775 RepID=UPI001BFE228A|nr:DNA-binding protein [Polynucleobacter paneuropaeus]QWD55204.1 DNA-binding protein [Polynucleobacter paneuropaeus]
MTVCEQEALFDSAHAAMVFAFNISTQCFDRPLLARMATPARSDSKGLSGLDGAAQAGMIRAEIHALGDLAENILTARFAPSFHPCSCRSKCCSGKQINPEWSGSIAWLANHVRNTALSGTYADYRVRRSCIIRHFQGKQQRITLEALADSCGIARNSAGAYVSRVSKFLKVMESQAYGAISDKLQSISVIA